MSDELKSAVDLALEKLEKELGEPVPKLTENQKERISQIRRRYQAKIAEAEIAAQASVKKSLQAGNFEAATQAQDRMVEQRKRFEAQMESEIASVRDEKGE